MNLKKPFPADHCSRLACTPPMCPTLDYDQIVEKGGKAAMMRPLMPQLSSTVHSIAQ